MDYKHQRKIIFFIAILVVLIGCSRPLTERRTTATAPAESGKSLRISSAGVGQGGFAIISAWLFRNLKPLYPDRDMWLDYHVTGTAFRDGLLLVADRKAEITLVNTHHLTAMALKGNGFMKRPIPLRAIAGLPFFDWCLFAVDAKHGIRSFADLKEKKVPLKIATGFLNDDNLVTFLLMEVLKRHGIDPEEFKRWGGQFVGSGTATLARKAYLAGEVDAIFQEAGFMPGWHADVKKRPTTFLSIEPAVARQMQEEFGWNSHTVPPNHYPGQKEEFVALDFSDWVLCVREDIEEELAYRIAQITVEKAREIDPQIATFGGTPNEFDPAMALKTSIPLHPGAQRYYREKGLLPN